MTFTDQQIEDFRYGLCVTREGATQAMHEVAQIIANRIRSEIDDVALSDGHSFYRGMERAAEIAGGLTPYG